MKNDIYEVVNIFYRALLMVYNKYNNGYPMI